ncbi:hypothetical protein BaRGS_00010502 [Batillaria attramentaria]|uniref:Uncharacterized protein n=1 Tax=Batillaria attramentaria TaxID=370345 RepID=A0ABD0LFJ8_9CAEN
MKWLRIKSVSLENVTELEDVECTSTTPGIELVSFAPLGRQNGFCVHDSSEDEREIDTETLVTDVGVFLLNVDDCMLGLLGADCCLEVVICSKVTAVLKVKPQNQSPACDCTARRP